jgi:hypothetical protein
MKKTCLMTLAFLGAVLAMSASLNASHYKMADGKGDFYYGRISLTQVRTEGADPLILREGETESLTAVLNMPIRPGDLITIPKGGRCEIQFDTGTILRLDGATQLTIETVLAPSLSSNSRISNIVLSAGRIYIMYKEYNSREIFQILTPFAALKMRNHTVALIEASEDGTSVIRIDNGRLEVMSGPDPEAMSQKTARKGENLAIGPDHRVESVASVPATDFDAWNAEVNRSFIELHDGLTPLPKPIRRLPRAVHHFAQAYGDRYGEWIWHDLAGYVWRPYFNDSYPGGSWRPYTHGSWQAVGKQMFWIPAEPWGWVPYHLGIWHWDKKRGWLWIPGSVFAPAWAAWDFFFGYYAWRPWGLWDWCFHSLGFSQYPGAYGFEPKPEAVGPPNSTEWAYRFPGSGDVPLQPHLTEIGKNRLKKAISSVTYPIPGNMKRVYRKAVSALKNGDGRVLESLREVPSQLVFLHERDIQAPSVHDKMLTWGDLAGFRKSRSSDVLVASADPHRAALRQFRALRPSLPEAGPHTIPDSALSVLRPESKVPIASDPKIDLGPDRPEKRPHLPGDDSTGPPSRFRDWNPDVPIARRLGASIRYSSRDNAVQCPKLRLASRVDGDSSYRPGRFVLSGEGEYAPVHSPISPGASQTDASKAEHGGAAAGSSAGSREKAGAEKKEIKTN